MQLKLFLSYGVKDARTNWLKLLLDELGRFGDLIVAKPGERDEETEAALKSCEIFLVVWNANVSADPFVKHQLQRAGELEKPVIFCLPDELPATGIPKGGRIVSYTGADWTGLQDLLTLTELELLIGLHRTGENDRGTDSSQALEEFIQLFGAEEDRKMRLFAQAAQAVGVKYPLGKDDQRKQLLLLGAIRMIDPEQTEEELQELRIFLEQQQKLDEEQ